jgi:hypothetical protein
MASRCLTCGQPTPPDAAAATTVTTSEPLPAYESSVPAPPPLVMTKELMELRGVGGWLMWFCVVVGFFQPLSFIAEIINSPDTLVVLVDLALVATAVTTAIMVYRVKPRAFTLLNCYFGAMLVLGALGIAGQFADDVELTTQEKLAPFRTLIFVVTWFWYFKVSKRVRVNFGRNL